MRLAGRRRPFGRVITIVLVALLALLSIDIAAAQAGVPEPITDEGETIRDLYYFVLVLAAIVFVLVEGVLIFCILRFRKRDENLPPQIHGSNTLELIWTGIPVLIVASIFTLTFIALDDIENDADPEDLTVEVTGFQWQWSFKYNLNDLGQGSNPDETGAITVSGVSGKNGKEPELVIPAGEVVEFKLVAADVIHSFYIRDFLYKLDLIPGRDNRFTVTPRVPGVYHAQCAEYCGTDHAFMRFTLRVVERDEFDAWVQEQSAATAAREP